jgi:two-component system cell cycle sensor histidine kinase/response regulator CckA
MERPHSFFDAIHPDDRPRVLASIQAAERAAALTRQLLTFSRRQVVEPMVLELESVLDELRNLLRRLIGEDVCLAVIPSPGLSQVSIDPGQGE